MAAAAAPSVPAPRFRFELADGAQFEASLAGLSDGRLQLVGDGFERSLASGEVLFAWGPPAPDAAATMADLAVLPPRPGASTPPDQWWGRWLTGDESSVLFELDGGLAVRIPFEHLERLVPHVDRPLDRLLELQTNGIDDRLWRRRSDGGLDGVTGVLLRVDDQQLVLESALGELEFGRDDVLLLALAGTEHPGLDVRGWPLVVRLRGGSCFEAGLTALEGDLLRLDTCLGRDLEVRAADVSALLLAPPAAAGGPLRLADLTPASVREWTSLGEDAQVLFPWRRGLSVSGQLLSVGGRLATTGIGVHANARLHYQVPAGVSALRVTVGLADEVLHLPAAGSVQFEVLVDGVSRLTTGVLREGQAPLELRVDGLRAGQALELVTRDGGDRDAGDRALWVDGLLLR